MLEVVFTAGVDEIEVGGLTQWDRGQKINITSPNNLPAIYQVHFTFKGGTKALSVLVTDSTEVEIPDELLTQPRDLIAYVYYIEEDGSGETVKTINLPVVPRAKPEDYTELPPTYLERVDAMLASIKAESDNAVATSENALSISESAFSNSQNAVSTANAANTKSDNAVETANEAKETSDEALQRVKDATSHAHTHATSGNDPLTPGMIGAYTKEEVVSDETKTLFGLDASALPNDVFEAIETGKVRVIVGSYIGTGTTGAYNGVETGANMLTFDFAPKIVVIPFHSGGTPIQNSDGGMDTVVMDAVTTEYSVGGFCVGNNTQYAHVKKSEDGKTLYWYTTYGTNSAASHIQLNYPDTVYHYYAIG